MKNTVTARPIPTTSPDGITITFAEPVVNNGQQTVITQRVVERKESSITGTLILAAGILFWAHGSASHDAWFKGETVTGEAITGFYIALVGLVCCCCCLSAPVLAANSHDSEIEALPTDASRANRFLTNNAPRQLMTDLFKASDKADNALASDSVMIYGV